MHKRVKCLITHREVGLHASSFATALRPRCARIPTSSWWARCGISKPSATPYRAAEMGFLVLATLHTNSASKTVDRIIDMFPSGDQEQIRISLAESLKAVVAQQLVKRADGHGRVAAFEVLLGSAALGNIIREGRTQHIASVIQNGRDQGMMLMDHFLHDLVDKRLITMAEAREKCTDLRNFEN